jgi:hypothetical protein
MVYESLELVLGRRPRTLGGVGRGLALAYYGVTGARFHLSLMSLSTSRGHDALLQAGLILPHARRGMSTITTRLERCTSLGSMGNSSGTRYPPQSMWSLVVPHRETSHKSSAIKPFSPQPSPEWSEGKMPPPRGGQPGRLQSGRLEHRER